MTSVDSNTTRTLHDASAQTTALAFPMSFSQQRLWFLDQLSPGSVSYNVEAAIPLDGPIDLDAIGAALNAIIERHGVLRTNFREQDGEPCQIVLSHRTIDVPVIDIRHLAPGDRDAEVEQILTRQARSPFDLAHDPLIRASIIAIEPDRHIFALQLHHIVADGWSMGIFGRELTVLYNHFSASAAVDGSTVTRPAGLPGPPDLPELPIQYADYAVWQRSWLSGDVLNDQLSYWTDRLTGLPTLELPTDRPRPLVQNFEGTYHNVVFPPGLHARLVELSKREQCTLFITLLAAFKLLLARWSGQTDIVVGTYIANRRRSEVENLIGFFLNTLVLRTTLDGECSFSQLLQRVRDTALGAYEHQDLPFEFLVDALKPERDMSRNPLVQVTFQLNNAPTQNTESNSTDAIEVRRGTSIFDLAFLTFETADGLAGQIEYSTSLFDATTIDRLATQYVTLLEGLCDDPDADIARIPIVTSAELQQIEQMNDTARPRPWEVSLIDLFDEQVDRDPSATAFFDGDTSLDYATLQHRSLRIADDLRTIGVLAGDVVGVHFARSLDAPAAILGIARVGAAWLPLEPHLPAERLAFMTRDSGATAIVTAGDHHDPHVFGAVPVLNLSDARHRADPSDDLLTAGAAPPPIEPNSLAYMIYTSGSTGRPKGVGAPHGQILNRLHWMWETYPFVDGEVGSFKTSLGFIDSIWEIFGPLLKGVPSVVIDDDTVRDPHALVAQLASAHVSRLWLVPSLLRVLLDNFPDLRTRLPHLNVWVSSGESLSLDLFRRFRSAMGDATLLNLYGTSEVWDASICDPSELDLRSGWVPIGQPIDNVRVYIVDEARQLVPIGVPGELCVAGAGLAFGYRNQPQLQQDQFVTITLPGGRTERVYRTGDRARLRSDSHVEHLGRLDTQTKIRGVRVEPGEVEAAMMRHPAVVVAAVRAIADGHGASLTAWYESDDVELPDRELREHLARIVPSALVPSRFVRVASMPTTTSGKIDRTALPDPSAAPQSARAAHAPPVGVVEEQLAAIWADVLSVERVGRTDDFFADLGGHSLQATQLISRIASVMGIQLPLRVVFESSTVAGVAAAIERAQQRGDDTTDAAPIARLSRAAYRRPS